MTPAVRMMSPSTPTTSRCKVAGSRLLAIRRSAEARRIRSPDSCIVVKLSMIGRSLMELLGGNYRGKD